MKMPARKKEDEICVHRFSACIAIVANLVPPSEIMIVFRHNHNIVLDGWMLHRNVELVLYYGILIFGQ